MNPNMAWRIKVTFAGALLPKNYISPDVRCNDPGWGSELFNRDIEKLEFYLPTGHRLVMAGMEQYNFFIEALQDIGGRFSEKVRVQAFWFCGKLPGHEIVEMWRIGNNKITRSRSAYGKEWRGEAVRGWKQGVQGAPVSQIV